MVDLLSLDVNKPEDYLAAGLEYTICKDEYLEILDEVDAVGRRLLDIANEAKLSSLLSKMSILREVFSKDQTNKSNSTLNSLDICIESIEKALEEKK